MTSLEQLLADWAATRRLTDVQIASIRATVLASREARTEHELDADWLWSLLRPLTSLIDNTGDVVPYVQLA